MGSVTELIQRKSALLLDLETARPQKKKRTIVELASLAATLEGQVARKLVKANRQNDAVVNLIS
jgi:hypothetical protein